MDHADLLQIPKDIGSCLLHFLACKTVIRTFDHTEIGIALFSFCCLPSMHDLLVSTELYVDISHFSRHLSLVCRLIFSLRER